MLDEAHVIRLINSIPGYEALFKEAFPDDLTPISYDNIAKAIGAFERKLVTPSRWDKFLKGDDTALNEEELEGFNTFASSGCLACHNGALVGGTTYQQVGSVKPWPNQEDQGRFEVTKDPSDKMMFKAPSLRNVAMTAPYFHDGSVKTLSEAVKEAALGVAKDAPVGFQAIRLRFDLDSDASEEQLATLMKLTERYCVVYQTLRQPPAIEVRCKNT